MKLTLRQEWRPRAVGSFLGFMDLKIGVIIALLFAILNKVAGIYGLIAVFTGGSFAQVSLYIYSVAALLAFAWGLRAVGEEDPKRTLYFAHFFFADHIFSTAWTAFFAVVWWVYTPHDGQRTVNSAAQDAIRQNGGGHDMSDEERAAAAMMIWNKEKGLATLVVIAGWCVKIYFAILLYSYAVHLRKGSYRSLPRTTSTPSQYTMLNAQNGSNAAYPDTALGELDEDEIENLYRAPARTPFTGSSVGSFAEFVHAPPGSRSRSQHTPSRLAGGKPGVGDEEVAEEVLFDSDEHAPGGEYSHSSKFGTEESTSVSSRDEHADS